MADRPCSPRIPPLARAEQSGRARDLLDSAMLPDANIFTTLVRAPGLFAKWLPFGGKLLNGKLPGRDRELLILRTAWNCRAEYEWAQHVVIAGRIGLTDEEMGRVAGGPPGLLGAFDATLLAAADELHADSCITDLTWSALAERYDDSQLIEVPMVVGHYHLVAMTLNTLGVDLDPGLAGFPTWADP